MNSRDKDIPHNTAGQLRAMAMLCASPTLSPLEDRKARLLKELDEVEALIQYEQIIKKAANLKPDDKGNLLMLAATSKRGAEDVRLDITMMSMEDLGKKVRENRQRNGGDVGLDGLLPGHPFEPLIGKLRSEGFSTLVGKSITSLDELGERVAKLYIAW